MLGLVVDRVITARKDEVLGKTVVIINTTSGKIENVQPFSSDLDKIIPLIELPPNYTILPGFIDCHIHLTIPVVDYQMDHLRCSSAEKALRAMKKAQGLLAAGFTTLRSAGDADTYYPTFAVAKSIAKGEFVGPRIVGAGHYISVTGGGGDINFMSADNCPCCSADGLIANGKEQMILAVRKEIKFGADWIKILVTGAFMTAAVGPKDSPENTHMSEEEIKICVEEANRRKVHVMAHAHGAHGIVAASNAGCRSIEHASFIDEEGIQACLKNNTYIVPTFSVGAYFDIHGSDSGAQDRMIQLQRETNQRYYTCIQNAVKAGVNVALGSDYVGWEPSITAREFRYMVEKGGMTPLQSILAGTSNAADLLELSHLIGRIEIDKLADIVIIEGNPLDDISLLETNIRVVMKNGQIVRDDLLLLGHQYCKSCCTQV